MIRVLNLCALVPVLACIPLLPWAAWLWPAVIPWLILPGALLLWLAARLVRLTREEWND